METLLSIDPADRGTAASPLKSNFFTTIPLLCHPSSLPKYPSSKEFDAKFRDEEARRGLPSDDQREQSITAQPEVPKLTGRFPGSFKEDRKSDNKDPILQVYSSKGHKIHYTWPLLMPSGNMDQALKNQLTAASFFVSGC